MALWWIQPLRNLPFLSLFSPQILCHLILYLGGNVSSHLSMIFLFRFFLLINIFHPFYTKKSSKGDPLAHAPWSNSNPNVCTLPWNRWKVILLAPFIIVEIHILHHLPITLHCSLGLIDYLATSTLMVTFTLNFGKLVGTIQVLTTFAHLNLQSLLVCNTNLGMEWKLLW
jgi:hypothetical protein